jgi:hypothetical protein
MAISRDNLRVHLEDCERISAQKYVLSVFRFCTYSPQIELMTPYPQDVGVSMLTHFPAKSKVSLDDTVSRAARLEAGL